MTWHYLQEDEIPGVDEGNLPFCYNCDQYVAEHVEEGECPFCGFDGS